MVTTKQFRAMSSQSGKLTVPEFNTFVLRACGGNVKRYLCIPQPGLGLQTRLVTSPRFTELWNCDEYAQFDKGGIRILVPTADEVGYTANLIHPLYLNRCWMKGPTSRGDYLSFP